VTAAWSYGLSVLGATGMLIAASRPKAGWWFNLAALPAWIVYAVVTRQWGFVVLTTVYGVGYVRLLRRAYQPSTPAASRPTCAGRRPCPRSP
jgi:hypothetical protein